MSADCVRRQNDGFWRHFVKERETAKLKRALRTSPAFSRSVKEVFVKMKTETKKDSQFPYNHPHLSPTQIHISMWQKYMYFLFHPELSEVAGEMMDTSVKTDM